jgi:arginine exporter protein ArgO
MAREAGAIRGPHVRSRTAAEVKAMVLVRALLPAFILTFLAAAILAAAGTQGGVLAIQAAPVMDYHVFWSWPLFLLFTGLAWALFSMMK